MNAHERNSYVKRVIRRPEVLKITGLSPATIWRMEQDGRFPKRVSLGKNSCGWLSSEIDAWYDNLTKSRDTAAEGFGDE